MESITELFQCGDWKSEKHVPIIEVPEKVKKGEAIRITASVGKEIPHPNKTDHHITWIEVYFLPQGEKFPYQIARTEFCAHGASGQGADTSSVYAKPEVILSFKTDKQGLLFVSSYCNIHGLWQNTREIKLE